MCGGVLSKRGIIVISLLLMAFLSATVLGSLTSSTDFHASTFATLDKQKENVSVLLVSASAASATISMLPGDAGSSIADELANLSSYFILTLSILYAEKFLLTSIGYIVFTLIVPISLLLIIWQMMQPKRHWMFGIAMRILALGLAVYFAIPLSAKICDNINKTYNDTIQVTVEMATQAGKLVEEASAETETEVETEAETEAETDDGNFLNKVGNTISNVAGNIANTVSNAASSVAGAISGGFEEAKDILDRFIEAVAVMLVTSCVIPLLVLFCLVKIAKALFNASTKAIREHQYFETLDRGTDNE